MTEKFNSDGVEIAFIDEGEGFPTLLIHGFASNHRVNWVSTSWVRDLIAAGRRVIAFDNRGHGESGKPHDPSAYAAPLMAEDARRLLDHLGIGQADVIGYSMGARIARVSRAQSSGSRAPRGVRRPRRGMVKGIGPSEPIAEALRAPSLDDVTDPRAREFRLFADQTESDREALAACILAARQTLTPEELARISAPVLVAVGSEDEVAGDAEALAALIPRAERHLSFPAAIT